MGGWEFPFFPSFVCSSYPPNMDSTVCFVTYCHLGFPCHLFPTPPPDHDPTLLVSCVCWDWFSFPHPCLPSHVPCAFYPPNIADRDCCYLCHNSTCRVLLPMCPPYSHIRHYLLALFPTCAQMEGEVRSFVLSFHRLVFPFPPTHNLFN